jgi:hypothetical protein
MTFFLKTRLKSIMTPTVLEEYDVNIFFITDHADPHKVSEYFGSRIKKLVQLDFEDKHLVDLEEVIKKYHVYYTYRKSNPHLFPHVLGPRDSYPHYFYKIYYACHEMKEYEQRENVTHDIIFVIRPDTHFINHVNPFLKQLEVDSYIQIFMSRDWGYFGRRDLFLSIAELIWDYGKYNFREVIQHDAMVNVENNYYLLGEYFAPGDGNRPESPEVQLYETIMEYCVHHGFNDLKRAIHSLTFAVVNESRHKL